MGLDALKKYCDENRVSYKTDEMMCCHTSFKIGGAADIFITVSSLQELKGVLQVCKAQNIPHFIIGKGSNLLVSDKGIEGAVISLCYMNDISIEKDEIKCGAGVSLSEVCRKALNNSLSGLEFAYGIPGSVGGAVFMNAGAYGGEIADVILSACCIDKDGKVITVQKNEMNLGYRTSIFKTEDMTVLSAVFGLKKADKGIIEGKMQEYIGKRRDKQPLEYPSAGSFFKRPTGYFAGALIEKNGLKGFTVGGAKVSEKHAGFVINSGNATSEDVEKLSREVREKVFAAEGVMLEPEVIFIGRK